VVEHGRGVNESGDAVMNKHVNDGEAERYPALIQGDHRKHDEEVEMHLDEATGDVRQGGGSGDQAETGGGGAYRAVANAYRLDDAGEEEDSAGIQQGMTELETRGDREPEQGKCLDPDQCQDRAVARQPDVGRKRRPFREVLNQVRQPEGKTRRFCRKGRNGHTDTPLVSF
jgi:hypothetical protein